MKKIKKILIVSTIGLIYDGITSVILAYLQEMNQNGLDIYVAGTIDVKPNIRKKLEDTGCTVVDFPNRRSDTFQYFIYMTKFIKENDIEVIHAHGNSATLTIEMTAAWLGGCKKRIAHSHNTICDKIRIDKLLRPVFYVFYTDALACGTAAGKWLFGNRQFDILVNGRNPEKYKFRQQKREELRRELNIGDNIAIGHVGGFFEQKNHSFLVEIYREIKKMKPDCKLFMIGDGPLKSEIEKQSQGLDVVFTGSIDNVNDYLNAMDVMVLPSLFEGLPLVTIEWQINGLPAVVSEAVTGECKLTDSIEFLSLDALAQKWAEVIINSVNFKERQKNADSAYESIRKSRFNIKNNVEKLERMYLRGK